MQTFEMCVTCGGPITYDWRGREQCACDLESADTFADDEDDYPEDGDD